MLIVEVFTGWIAELVGSILVEGIVAVSGEGKREGLLIKLLRLVSIVELLLLLASGSLLEVNMLLI